jgi:hypothetical protein
MKTVITFFLKKSYQNNFSECDEINLINRRVKLIDVMVLPSLISLFLSLKIVILQRTSARI